MRVMVGSHPLCTPGSCTGGTAVSETCAHYNHVCSLFPLSQTVTLFPAVLTRPAGESATFFCNISVESDSVSEYSLNWYKETNHSQAQKIAEISRNNPPMDTGKYLLTNHTPAFKIEILNLHQNDSGSYYCGLITFFEPDKVMESNRSHLVVTGQPGGWADGDRSLVLSGGAMAPRHTAAPGHKAGSTLLGEDMVQVRRAQLCPFPSPLHAWSMPKAAGCDPPSTLRLDLALRQEGFILLGLRPQRCCEEE